jgi:hypothetical protein
MAVSEVGMTRREQQIETRLRERLKAAGFRIWQDGDVFAGLNCASIMCFSQGTEINVSELARDIERALA